MSSHRDKRTNAMRRGLIAAAFALVALLALSGTALAGTDDLKGGSVTLQLQSSRGLKLKPRSLNLPITSGAIDPIDGSGIAYVSGAFKARRGKGKTKVKLISLTLGANGGQGGIAAKVGKDLVNSFGILRGGTVSRDGFGARIENVTATIGSKGARALSRALSGVKGKKRKRAGKSAGRRVKAGQPLGTIVSMTTVPLAVQVVPGTGSMVLHTNAMGAFVSKLPDHCISPLPTGSPPGVQPIAPATTSGLLGTDYTFPVTSGSVAPDFSAGELFTAGGQTLTKNNDPTNPNQGACTAASPPTGTKLLSTDLSVTFTTNSLRSIATLPSGTALPRAPLATIDWSTGSRSVDPKTGAVTITGATVRLADLAAQTLNQIFPNESGTASNDFATGDLLGTIDVTGVKLR